MTTRFVLAGIAALWALSGCGNSSDSANPVPLSTAASDASSTTSVVVTSTGSSPDTTESTSIPGSSAPKAAVDRAAPYDMTLDPADFVDGVDNPFFPLSPGSRWIYTTTTKDGTEHNTVVVLHRTRTIMGIDAVVVHDTIKIDGKLMENTFDWYAQDVDGTVWYLGENTKEMKNGKVTSTEGSWEAGVDGAQPGVIMQAQPEVGGWYWQEYRKGHAEDQARVVALDGTANVPEGSFTDLVVIEERSPLERNVVGRKYYHRGIGVVFEDTTKGPKERSVLETSDMR